MPNLNPRDARTYNPAPTLWRYDPQTNILWLKQTDCGSSRRTLRATPRGSLSTSTRSPSQSTTPARPDYLSRNLIQPRATSGLVATHRSGPSGDSSSETGLDGTGVRLALIIHHARPWCYQRCRQPHDRANPARRPFAGRPDRLADRANDHHTGPVQRGSRCSHAAAR
jgi:hypothetical protein